MLWKCSDSPCDRLTPEWWEPLRLASEQYSRVLWLNTYFQLTKSDFSEANSPLGSSCSGIGVICYLNLVLLKGTCPHLASWDDVLASFAGVFKFVSAIPWPCQHCCVPCQGNGFTWILCLLQAGSGEPREHDLSNCTSPAHAAPASLCAWSSRK